MLIEGAEETREMGEFCMEMRGRGQNEERGEVSRQSGG